ncbi:Enteropeptidase [Mactra antiquata]
MPFLLICRCFIILSVIIMVGCYGCGKRDVKQMAVGKRIVGGQEAEQGSWPWMVMLRLNHIYKCGGSILSSRVIITAAHCVNGHDAQDFEVITGKHNKTATEETETTYKIEHIVMHGLFNKTNLIHDIALLVLQEDITYSEFVGPVCLPAKTMSYQQPCYSIGWGNTKGTGDDDVLRQVEPTPVSPIYCYMYLKNKSPILARRNFCRGSQTADACYVSTTHPSTKRFYFSTIFQYLSIEPHP